MSNNQKLSQYELKCACIESWLYSFLLCGGIGFVVGMSLLITYNIQNPPSYLIKTICFRKEFEAYLEIQYNVSAELDMLCGAHYMEDYFVSTKILRVADNKTMILMRTSKGDDVCLKGTLYYRYNCPGLVYDWSYNYGPEVTGICMFSIFLLILFGGMISCCCQKKFILFPCNCRCDNPLRGSDPRGNKECCLSFTRFHDEPSSGHEMINV